MVFVSGFIYSQDKVNTGFIFVYAKLLFDMFAASCSDWFHTSGIGSAMALRPFVTTTGVENSFTLLPLWKNQGLIHYLWGILPSSRQASLQQINISRKWIPSSDSSVQLVSHRCPVDERFGECYGHGNTPFHSCSKNPGTFVDKYFPALMSYYAAWHLAPQQAGEFITMSDAS